MSDFLIVRYSISEHYWYVLFSRSKFQYVLQDPAYDSWKVDLFLALCIWRYICKISSENLTTMRNLKIVLLIFFQCSNIINFLCLHRFVSLIDRWKVCFFGYFENDGIIKKDFNSSWIFYFIRSRYFIHSKIIYTISIWFFFLEVILAFLIIHRIFT